MNEVLIDVIVESAEAIDALAFIEDHCRTDQIAPHFESIRAALYANLGKAHYDQLQEDADDPAASSEGAQMVQ